MKQLPRSAKRPTGVLTPEIGGPIPIPIGTT